MAGRVTFSRRKEESTSSDLLDDDFCIEAALDRSCRIEVKRPSTSWSFRDERKFSEVDLKSEIKDPSSWPLSEEEIRMSVAKYVASKPLLSSTFIQAMRYESLSPSLAYHYQLRTLTEGRESYTVEIPWKDSEKKIDDASNTSPPPIWEIVVHPPTSADLFTPGSKKVNVPHTNSLLVCPKCGGVGRLLCHSCSGKGRRSCFTCSGKGKLWGNDRSDTSSISITCRTCSGTGRKGCVSCSSSGKVKCRRCEGSGKVLQFVEMLVTWQVTTDNFVSSPPSYGLTDRQVMQATGSLLLDDLDERVKPLQDFPDEKVERASYDAIRKNSSVTKRILKQRQSVRGIPLFSVSYAMEGKGRGQFVIFGEGERQVHFPNYPKGCVIL